LTAMEPLGNIIRRVVGKDQRRRRRLVHLQAVLDDCLKGSGIRAKVTAVRKNTLFLSVTSQVDKSEIEAFYQERIVERMNRKLKTTRFEKVRVKVER